MQRKILFETVLTLYLVFFIVSPVFAQSEPPGETTGDVTGDVSDDMVNAIARQLYCPVCENIPLDVCPTQACEEWRQDIREKLMGGWSEPQIRQYFVDRYGDRVLAAPPARGLNWMVYLIPPIVIIASAVFLFRTLNQWRRQPPRVISEKTGATRGEVAETEADVYIRQLEEELGNRTARKK